MKVIHILCSCILLTGPIWGAEVLPGPSLQELFNKNRSQTSQAIYHETIVYDLMTYINGCA